MTEKKVDFVGKRLNLKGLWQIKSADGTTYHIPVKHFTEPAEKKGKEG